MTTNTQILDGLIAELKEKNDLLTVHTLALKAPHISVEDKEYHLRQIERLQSQIEQLGKQMSIARVNAIANLYSA